MGNTYYIQVMLNTYCRNPRSNESNGLESQSPKCGHGSEYWTKSKPICNAICHKGLEDWVEKTFLVVERGPSVVKVNHEPFWHPSTDVPSCLWVSRRPKAREPNAKKNYVKHLFFTQLNDDDTQFHSFLSLDTFSLLSLGKVKWKYISCLRPVSLM